MLDKIKVAFVLFLIGALSGASIYFVNEATVEAIADNRLEQEIGLYEEIFPEIDSFTKEDLDGLLVSKVTILDVQGECLGYIYKGDLTNNYGVISVMVGITKDGLVANTIISASTNTPTFVQTIKSDYLSGFSGQDINEEIQIDTRTGATYTYTSVVTVVNAAVTYQLENGGE